MTENKNIERVSVLVPQNPFTPSVRHCLCALDVVKLMEWWPGLPHSPKKVAAKVKAIQRSLDWKRVAQIAAYLMQEEIEDCGKRLDEIFSGIYQPKRNDPGREWPPKIKGTVAYAKSSFPFFSNILVHVNGATLDNDPNLFGAAELKFTPNVAGFNLTVIDGQHRVNGAYFAFALKQEKDPNIKFEIPAEVFIDLDAEGAAPVRQASIFIDVNLYQKKVDRSLVDDLFPTARGNRPPLDRKERAQDIGRKLMLETGPLVGMIQIPGIKYGVKDVVTLATLNSAIERAIPIMDACDIPSLEAQTSFLARLLECWLKATGRNEAGGVHLTPSNVVYQGRILVSVIDLAPAVLSYLKREKVLYVSDDAHAKIIEWLRGVIDRAGLLKNGKFVEKDKFKELGFLGSGGIGRFRDRLWAASFQSKKLGRFSQDNITQIAGKARAAANKSIDGYVN